MNRQIRLSSLPRLLPILVVVLLSGCGPAPRTLAERERQAEQQRLLRLCQQLQPRLPQLLKGLAQAQQQQAAVASSTYSPTPGPRPLNPEEQRRLTMEDQQTEQELHDQAVEAWRTAEAERRERWEREHGERERAAESALDAAAAALRQVHPDLLQAGAPPQLNRAEADRFRMCQPERFR